MAGNNGGGPVNLLNEHDPRQLVRPSRPAEGQLELGPSNQARCKAVGTTKDETDRRAVLGPPFLQQAGQRRAFEIFASPIKHDDDSALRDDVGDRDRFLDPPPFGVLCPALANFDHFDGPQTERTAGRFGALTIRRGELSLGTLFEAADRRDYDAHGWRMSNDRWLMRSQVFARAHAAFCGGPPVSA